MGVLSKVCMAEGVTPLETAFWRAAFGLLFFLGHTLFTRQIAVPPRVAANFILFGVWGIGVFYSVTQYAIKLSGAAMAVALRWPSIKGHRPMAGHPALTRIILVRIQPSQPFFRQVPALHMSGQTSSKGPNR